MGMGVSAVSIHDMDNISETPFRHRAMEPNISTLNQSPKAEILRVQPTSLRKILLANPDTIFCGEKQKAITLTKEVADKPSLSSAPVKNVREWNCSLCQVSTTNQDCLNAHFQGKKHKHKEENKNWSIGLFPKKSKFIQLVECPYDDLISSPDVNDPPSLLIDNNADNLRNNTAHEKQNNREFTFWCETCKIGTFSEKTMEAHRVGKKHVRHIQQLTGKDKQC
ncbi:hypothetical protein KY290_026812 [Solanum tuberosum]|uniref:U1-type domain-containing protein n=1 Tax=Solanum tuberosum TaxID=4113 RepID=A0ABQ7UXL1_SOLTU|nr:hypothetical protein KY285_024852 [Solanum tuberosum]KAH0756542.1 hypothetical protein KY290_026812 [Solanum tuberosum]